VVFRVADDFFLIAHDDRSGRLRVAAAAAGLGLAAALLGELVVARQVTVHGGELYPMVADPPTDGLQREVLRLIQDPRQQRDLDTWLRFLAGDALADVRQRLLVDGALVRVEAPWWARIHGVRHRPTDVNAAVWPAIRLAGMLSRHERPSLSDAVLTGLVGVTGLLGHVLWFPDEHAPGWEHAAVLRRALPAPLGTLVAHTAAAVGQSVLTRRGG
jgi:hypothetical protein